MFFKIGIFFLWVLASCTRNGLYVQEERVDRNFLASSWAETPDPRQLDPPQGQRLLIAWDFPYFWDVTIVATVRFWDETEKIIRYPITRKQGSTAFFFPDQTILTYLVEAVLEDGEVISTWEHQLWTQFIELGRKMEALQTEEVPLFPSNQYKNQ